MLEEDTLPFIYLASPFKRMFIKVLNPFNNSKGLKVCVSDQFLLMAKYKTIKVLELNQLDEKTDSFSYLHERKEGPEFGAVQ